MASATQLEFEKPIVELERQIDEIKRTAGDSQMSVAEAIEPLERKLEDLREEVYKNLTPFQRVQVARNPKRPFTADYIKLAFTDFIELHGDRAYRDDAAIIGGWSRLDDDTVMVIGHQRGRDTKEQLRRNFGMPHPEGYRKALRLMKLAEKFHVPVLTFIDIQGAWAGLGAEDRGQSEAIARNLYEMSQLTVPIIATVIGEGGSGGALALGVADRVLMMENAVYSVISVEGCAAILWKDAKSPEMREKAAAALRITAPELLERVGLTDRSREPISQFSKGMVQRLALAQALLNDPDLLVLDEPAEGLDQDGRRLLHDVIADRRHRGRSVLFVSHVLADVEQLCDRLAVLVRGRLAYVGALAALTGADGARERRPLTQALDELYTRPPS